MNLNKRNHFTLRITLIFTQLFRDKLDLRKKYLKIYNAVDIKNNKSISLKVTDEHVHDGKVLPKLVEDIKKSKHMIVDKILADGAYDRNAVFGCLADYGIMLYIKVRKKAKIKKTNHNLNLLVISQRKNVLQRWKDNSVSYGQRWTS
jgi:hypothetical protein